MSFSTNQETTEDRKPGSDFDHSGTCEVCRKIDGDASSKPVRYCMMCKAWICPECWGNFYRRTVAALKEVI